MSIHPNQKRWVCNRTVRTV